MRLGQGRAERRHRGAEPGAMQGDDIHIPFDDDDRRRLAGLAAREIGAGRRPGIEHAPLLEERRVGRVQVFRLVVSHRAAAKGDDPPGAVTDREQHAAAEIVVWLAATFRPAQQAAFDQQGFRKFAGQRAAQRLPVIGRPAEPEAPDCLLVETPRREVFAGAGPGRRP